MARKILYFILLILLVSDTAFSFRQHYSQALESDMATVIVPAKDFIPILESPFGTDILLKNKSYPNPNRFFSHWTFKEYFSYFPLFLQKFTDPIESIYLSCAISKIIIQIVLIFLLAFAISGTINFLRFNFILAAVLVTPFFQTNGYQNYMGIIDTSATYTFFYALPITLLILYFSPFIQEYYHAKKTIPLKFLVVLWVPLAIIVCLSGPINPGIVLTFSFLILFVKMKRNFINSDQQGTIKKVSVTIKMIPDTYWFYLIPVNILSIYSLFIARFGSINDANQYSTLLLYLKLPVGIYYQFTQKLGFPVLFAILFFNYFIIRKLFKTAERDKIVSLFKWIGIFALFYILLLPIGGYRPYRPNILRYDTILPITLSLMFIFGISTLFLLKKLNSKQKIWYIPVIISVLFIFTNSDEGEFDKNKCEKIALKEISESKDKIVQIQSDCTVLSWGKILKPEKSELNAQLLYIWGVTTEKRLYYNK